MLRIAFISLPSIFNVAMTYTTTKTSTILPTYIHNTNNEKKGTKNQHEFEFIKVFHMNFFLTYFYFYFFYSTFPQQLQYGSYISSLSLL